MNDEGRGHTLEGIAMGMLYFNHISSNSLGISDIVNFANHNMLAVKERHS